ncbi:MAG: hypothetical protein KDI51_17295 [Xanthomonadales bacterium]|nr:hypothetical protein [Xanthomonadales bacterium]
MRWMYPLVALFLIPAALLSSAPVQAQVDQITLNFGQIRYDYVAARPGALPFSLDLVVGEQGSLALNAARGQTLRFQSGQFFPVDPLAQSWLNFELADRMGPLGQLSVAIDQRGSSSAGGSPHIRVFDGQTGQSAGTHAGGANFLLADGSVRLLGQSADVTLRGAPASLFNQPGPGEPLEAHLPTPAPGQTIELMLKIWDDRGASTQLPVRISGAR